MDLRQAGSVRLLHHPGRHPSVEELATLVVEHGFDTPGDLIRSADEVIPKVRDLVAGARETR